MTARRAERRAERRTAPKPERILSGNGQTYSTDQGHHSS